MVDGSGKVLKRPKMIRTILAAGIGGAVSIFLYLIIVGGAMHTISLRGLLLWFASNVIGMPAFNGGLWAALLGFAMHCAVSVGWAAVYATVWSNSAWIRANVVPSGIIFGLAVISTMMFVVVPFGAAPKPTYSAIDYAINAVAGAAFGIPVALITRYFQKL